MSAHARIRTFVSLAGALLMAGCARANIPADPYCADRPDSTPVPLADLTDGCYLGWRGGLYPDGSNELTGSHLEAGRAAAGRIVPRDTSGAPNRTGRYVLLSIGMSNTSQEFCHNEEPARECRPPGFVAQADAGSQVNHTTLALVNGARGGRTATRWMSASSVEYDRIRDSMLTPRGLSEQQVQVAWVKVVNPNPVASLPARDADAFVLASRIGRIARTLKERYPNLQQVFLSSRIYAGYATTNLSPEPQAYESGFSVKWAIASQIAQMAGGDAFARTGNLRHDSGAAPWIGWGPYLWAAGTTRRRDGLRWDRSDFMYDGTHPDTAARRKVGTLLLEFFETSPVTSCWFLAGQTCSS